MPYAAARDRPGSSGGVAQGFSDTWRGGSSCCAASSSEDRVAVSFRIPSKKSRTSKPLSSPGWPLRLLRSASGEEGKSPETDDAAEKLLDNDTGLSFDREGTWTRGSFFSFLALREGEVWLSRAKPGGGARPGGGLIWTAGFVPVSLAELDDVVFSLDSRPVPLGSLGGLTDSLDFWILPVPETDCCALLDEDRRSDLFDVLLPLRLLFTVLEGRSPRSARAASVPDRDSVTLTPIPR